MGLSRQDSLLKFAALVGIGLLAYFVTHNLPFRMLFFLPQGSTNDFLGSIVLLPFGFSLIIFFESFFPEKLRQRLRVLLFGLMFFTLMPSLFDATVLLLVIFFTYLAASIDFGKLIDAIMTFALVALLLVVPLILGKRHFDGTASAMWLMVIFKMSLALRLVSYLVEKKIYRRNSPNNFLEYIEFCLCPIFFVLPGHIQFFRFGYFSNSKISKPVAAVSLLNILGLATWGLLLMSIFSWGITLYLQTINPRIDLSWSWTQIQLHFAVGVFWLVMVYLEQAGAMSFQVSLARLLGYNIKYDMHWPLLSRSPLDYLRRHSSYVRDYVVEIGLKPAFTYFVRKGFSSTWLGPTLAIVAYAIFVGAQTGPRADFYRPLLMTISMILILALFILLPLFKGLILRSDGHPVDNLARPIAYKALRSWGWRDYAAWLCTLILLIVSKAAINLAALYSLRP